MGYIRCSSSEKMRCDSQPIASSNNANEQRCKTMCDEKERCNFFFANAGWFCALFESCDGLRTSKGVGTILAKDTCSVVINKPEERCTDQNPFNWSCCTPSNPCILGGGDCDKHEDCIGNLVCGED